MLKPGSSGSTNNICQINIERRMFLPDWNLVEEKHTVVMCHMEILEILEY